MGHVKVVKSSPYFSRFQTKVRAAGTCNARASPLCSARGLHHECFRVLEDSSPQSDCPRTGSRRCL